MAYLLFAIGFAFYLVFSPTFLVQRFSLGFSMIGDFFAYMALWWAFASMILNKELTAKFTLRSLSLSGVIIAIASFILYVYTDRLWPYWIILAMNQVGGAFAWINLGAILSSRAPEHLQGRAMGVGGSMWSSAKLSPRFLPGHFPLGTFALLFL